MNRIVTTSTLALDHTPVQDDAWASVTEATHEVERLRALYAQVDAHRPAIDARMADAQRNLTSALRAYDASVRVHA